MRRGPGLSAFLLCLVGCSATPSTRDVRVTILDDAGEPLPGAVLYVEAYDDTGAFAFLTGAAGGAAEDCS